MHFFSVVADMAWKEVVRPAGSGRTKREKTEAPSRLANQQWKRNDTFDVLPSTVRIPAGRQIDAPVVDSLDCGTEMRAGWVSREV